MVMYEKAELVRMANGTDEEQRKVMQYCYNLIENLLRKYLDMKEEYFPIVTLWIMGTYVHKSFSSYGYIYLNASSGSGKSRLLRLISSMSHNGKILIDPKEASTFRNASKGCNCIDEFEDMESDQKATIRKLLNAGYKKGGYVEREKEVRHEGVKDYVTERFDAYAPYAMANINGIDEVVKTRSISLALEKSNDPIKTRLIELDGFNGEYRHILEVIGMITNLTIKAENLFTGWNKFTAEYLDKYTDEEINESMDKDIAYENPLCMDVEYVAPRVHRKREESTENDKKEEEKVDENKENTTNTTYTTYIQSPTVYTSIHEFYKKVYETNIKGRYLELFFPILFLAYNISIDIFNNTINISEDIVKDDKLETINNNVDVIVLDFLNRIKGSMTGEFSLIKLFGDFKQFYGDSDKRFNVIWFGLTLKRLGVLKTKRRTGDGIIVSIDFERVESKFEVYKDIDFSESLEVGFSKKMAKKDEKSGIMEHFSLLASQSPQHDVLHEEWYDKFKDRFSSMEFEKIVQKIKQEGLIFEPKNGYYKSM